MHASRNLVRSLVDPRANRLRADDLERADVAGQAYGIGAVKRRHPQRVVVLPTARRHHPEFPVRPQSLHPSVGTQPHAPPGLDDLANTTAISYVMKNGRWRVEPQDMRGRIR